MVTAAPTNRWYPLRPHDEQRRLWDSPARFRVAACGRRSGKSELAKRRGVKLAMQPQQYGDARYVFGGPTHAQAKRVFWSDMKKLVPRWALAGQDPRRAISEGELTIHLVTGALIQVIGLDAPQRAEGVPIDFLAVDEAADVREEAWTEHLRPGLSERGGQAWLCGTPEGRNWFWRLATKAQEDTTGLWSFHTWPSSAVLDPAEIEIAKAELDARTYSQEFEASFLDITGRVYYAFDRAVHAAERHIYDPKSPLLIGLDFNVSPGVAVFVQERLYQGNNPRVATGSMIAAVVDEIWIERDSNTPAVCKEIIRRYQQHDAPVEIHADASGGAGHTSQVEGSDLDLLRKYLSPVFGEQVLTGAGRTWRSPNRLAFRVPDANPAVRSRINAVNSRLQSADDKVHLLVDPSCRHLIEDLEGVCWTDSGDIDKQSSPALSHISDGLGYLVNERWPVREHATVVKQY